ncbi:MAG: RNA pseudouridine synthase [Eubacteriales bacterium]|nr:RNA pseudouridine synthase [Eubacteriales bacterium]
MLDIIMEDDKKIIVYKKAGQLSQSGKSFDLDLVSEVMTYRRKKKEAPYAAIINRLDRPVSGLVLMAKDKKEAARLSALMQKEHLNKEYDAVICGKPKADEGEFVDYLLKDGKENISRKVTEKTAGAKCARLRYKALECECRELPEDGLFTMVHIQLITGRHHQIRVQFASRGLPILGDIKYGGMEFDECGRRYIGRNQIALCASSLTVDGKTYTVKPEWIE